MKLGNCIFLIDDDHINNFLNEKILLKAGLCDQVKCFDNGFSAIDHMRKLEDVKQFPDLVFLDLEMPIMDGFEFLEAFNRLKKPKPSDIIILSIQYKEYDMEHLRKLGSRFMITKPLTVEKLRSLTVALRKDDR